MWVYDEVTKKIVNKEIRYVPGLYKIFDEILVNAADNKQRDPSMNTIKVDINRWMNYFNNYLNILCLQRKKWNIGVEQW